MICCGTLENFVIQYYRNSIYIIIMIFPISYRTLWLSNNFYSNVFRCYRIYKTKIFKLIVTFNYCFSSQKKLITQKKLIAHDHSYVPDNFNNVSLA